MPQSQAVLPNIHFGIPLHMQSRSQRTGRAVVQQRHFNMMFILRDAMVPSKCCQMYISEYLSSCKGVSPSITAPCLFIWVPYYVLWPPHCSAFLRRFSMVFNLWEAMVPNKCGQTCISEYPSSRKCASVFYLGSVLVLPSSILCLMISTIICVSIWYLFYGGCGPQQVLSNVYFGIPSLS